MTITDAGNDPAPEEPALRGSPTDPAVFAAAPVVIVAVAIFACWIPARLASRIDPVASLQTD